MTHPHPLLAPLAPMLVKQGTALGGLSLTERELALAIVWHGMPDAPMSEREVNEALKLRLAGPGRCLSVDHVELRRWLVDSGFLTRDGYGREYRKLTGAALPERLQPIADAFEGLDVDAWAARLRDERDVQRHAKRAAWEAQQTRATA